MKTSSRFKSRLRRLELPEEATVSWGGIEGDILDQTDLSNALDGLTSLGHTHNISDVINLQSSLDGKQSAGSYANATHSHAISDVVNLQSSLDGKQAAGSYANTIHTHGISDVTNLLAELNSRNPGTSFLYNPGTGRYISNAFSSATLTTLAGASNRIDLAPYIPSFSFSIDTFAVLCSTGVASALGKVVVYNADSNGRPTSLVHETGNLDFATNGLKTISASVSFTRGSVYWLGIRHSSTATLNTHQTYTTPSLDWGAVPTSASALKILRRTLTFASAAPSTWNWVASEATAATPPAIFMRLV